MIQVRIRERLKRNLVHKFHTSSHEIKESTSGGKHNEQLCVSYFLFVTSTSVDVDGYVKLSIDTPNILLLYLIRILPTDCFVYLIKIDIVGVEGQQGIVTPPQHLAGASASI